MIIKGKKYVMSKGLAFYAELESQRFADELKKGWLIESINWLGFYRLKKVEPAEKQFVIDFYTGKKSEIEEYIELYKEASWEEVTRYRNKYFVFEAEKDATSVYTDEESFLSRIHKEFFWFMKNSFIFFGLCVFGTILLNQSIIRDVIQQVPVVYYFFSIFLLTGIMFPFIAAALFGYYKLIYAKRASYFKHPEKYAKRQLFLRDLVLVMLIGGILGGISGFIVGTFNLF